MSYLRAILPEGSPVHLALGMGMKAIAPVLGFSCIGRFDKKQGCDWTLGGLLPIHRLQVVVENGVIVPFFEFEEEKGGQDAGQQLGGDVRDLSSPRDPLRGAS